MSVIQEKKEHGIFMKISNGSINYSVTEDTPGNIKTEYKDKQTGETKFSYKMEVGGLLGKIVKLSYRDSEYGRNLEVRIKDGTETVNLQLKSESSLHHSFVNMIMNPSFDFNEVVEFSAWKQDKVSNGKTFTNNYLGLRQHGEKIDFTHTKQSNDGPQPEVKTVAGQKKWDFSPLEDYYYNVVIDKLIPILESITGSEEDAPQPKPQPKVEADMSKESSSNFSPKEEEDDDMPF